MKGYKVFNPDFTCRGFKFEEGKEYKHEGELKICNSGFHFCLKASHCFSYYSFDSNNIVCEVEALGNVVTHHEDSKVATDHIKIVRVLTWQEVLQVSNDGKENTGHSNTGYSNTGYRNTGYRNTGDSNTGDSNTGDWNTGDWNTGDRNTGYSNTGDRNTGAFCTGEAPFYLFNQQTDMTEEQFKNTDAFRLMRNNVDTKIWVEEYLMTDDEKNKYPSYKTAGGYLKDIPFKEAFGNAWHNWSEKSRNAFRSLPNFDASIFEEITGVKS